MNPLILAEMGCVAEGDQRAMRRLIGRAVQAGCDVVKNQWLSLVDRMVTRRRAEAYRAPYSWLAYPFAWHRDLAALARGLGLKYACSAYLPEDVAPLAEVVDVIKVASFEATDPAMHAALLATPERVRLVVSTGMLDPAGIDGLIDALSAQAHRLTVLVCTSAYPCPRAALRLRRLAAWRSEVDRVTIGYSDHSADVRTGGWAVCAGAEALEVHMRLDDTRRENPDAATALNPEQLAAYVRHAREAWEAMHGTLDAEGPMRAYRVTGDA